MGRKSRAKRERQLGTTEESPPVLAPKAVARYLTLVGRRPTFAASEHTQFWEWLLKRNGADAQAFTDYLDKGGAGGEQQAWELKNATFDLSLDFSMGRPGNLLESQLKTVAEVIESHKPSKVLDVGCENGLLTCFIADYIPEGEVHGLDRSPAAVEVAVSLASKLRLANARFGVGDLLKPTGAEGTADLVVASLTATQAAEYDVYSPRFSEAIENIAGMVDDGGSLLLIDRLASAEAIHYTLELLAGSGLSADLRESSMINFWESNSGGRRDDQRIPALTLVNSGEALPPSLDEVESFYLQGLA